VLLTADSLIWRQKWEENRPSIQVIMSSISNDRAVNEVAIRPLSRFLVSVDFTECLESINGFCRRRLQAARRYTAELLVVTAEKTIYPSRHHWLHGINLRTGRGANERKSLTPLLCKIMPWYLYTWTDDRLLRFHFGLDHLVPTRFWPRSTSACCSTPKWRLFHLPVGLIVRSIVHKASCSRRSCQL